MTLEGMAERLGMSPEELEVMKAEKAAGTLKTDYLTLEFHLGQQLRDQWAGRSVRISDRVQRYLAEARCFETWEARMLELEELLTRFGV